MDHLLEDIQAIASSGPFKASSHLDPSLYHLAKQDRLGFWQEQANKLVWESSFTKVLEWDRPFAKWFSDGKLNACVNCCDTHLSTKANKIAIIWQGENNSIKSLKISLNIQEKSLEGLFFPDTYYFFKGTSGIDILKESHAMMMQKLDLAWDNKTPNLPYKNKYEALIVASIIEKELGNRDEANLIAGVFVNRMRIGMPLQSDPTVIYGMHEKFNGNLTKQDLISDTPYNTYTRAGLPPGPICSPGMASINAALRASSYPYFYFVAMGNGRSFFSVSLSEHNQAVNRYQKGHKR